MGPAAVGPTRPQLGVVRHRNRIIDALKKSEPGKMPFGEPFRLDDPSWVSNRLAELLPLDLRARQKLMEFPDVGARIDAVHHVLGRHGWL